MHSLYLTTKKANLILYCWDFAGQDIYYPSHSFFLTNERSLYAIVFDLSVDGDDARIPFWLAQIDAAGAKNAPILIVGTHLDKCLNDLTRVEAIFMSLSQKFQTLYNIRGYFAVDTLHGDGIKSLKSQLCALIHEAPCVEQKLPANAYKVEKSILAFRKRRQQSGRTPTLSLRMLQDLASKVGCPDLLPSLRTWHQLGICLYYGSVSNNEMPKKGASSKAQLFLKSLADRIPELQDLIILDAQWLINLMACVISFKTSADTLHGTVSESVLRQLLLPALQSQQDPSPGSPPFSTGALPAGKDEEKFLHSLICLLQSFELLLPHDSPSGERLFLVPALLSPTPPPDFAAWKGGAAPSPFFSRVYMLRLMHIGLFPRLIVRIFRSAGVPLFLWREGIVLQYRGAQASVLVRADPSFSLQLKAFGENEIDCVTLFRLLCGTILNLLAFYGGISQSTMVICPFCAHLVPTDLFEFAFLVDGAQHCACPGCSKEIPLKYGIADLLLTDFPAFSTDVAQVQFGEKIAQGGFGIVFRGAYKGHPVAIKQLLQQHHDVRPKSPEDPTFHMAAQQFAELAHEAFIMAQCDHPNVVKLHGYSFRSQGSFILMEFLPGGTLFDAIHSAPPPAAVNNPILSLILALDIAKGLYHLHSRDPAISHGDLKSPNVLLSAKPDLLFRFPFRYWQACYQCLHGGSENPSLRQTIRETSVQLDLPEPDDAALLLQWEAYLALLPMHPDRAPLAKIADFGTSEPIFVDELSRDAIVENPIWLAPEQTDSLPSDVWSLGIIFYELFSWTMPFSHLNFKFSFQLGDAVKSGSRPDMSQVSSLIPASSVTLMQDCWKLSPGDRPSIDQIVASLAGLALEAFFSQPIEQD